MAATAPPRIKAAQRSALTVLVIGGTLNYIDRATLSVANPLIRNDLGLSIADMGLLLSAFLWAYAFFQLPGAYGDDFPFLWFLFGRIRDDNSTLDDLFLFEPPH